MRHRKGALAAPLPRGKPRIHGGYSFLASGKLPEHRRAVLAYLSAARAALVRDLGPTEYDLTAAQIILIDRTVTALGIVRCIEEYIRENSVMRGQDVAPALQQSYLAYVNHVRLNLVALGIKTKAGEGILDLAAYVREHDKQKSQAKPRKASPKAAPGQAGAEGQSKAEVTRGLDRAEIVNPGASSEALSGQGEEGIGHKAEGSQDQAPAGGEIGQPGDPGRDVSRQAGSGQGEPQPARGGDGQGEAEPGKE
jgi:hypothetical protein